MRSITWIAVSLTLLASAGQSHARMPTTAPPSWSPSSAGKTQIFYVPESRAAKAIATPARQALTPRPAEAAPGTPPPPTYVVPRAIGFAGLPDENVRTLLQKMPQDPPGPLPVPAPARALVDAERRLVVVDDGIHSIPIPIVATGGKPLDADSAQRLAQAGILASRKIDEWTLPTLIGIDLATGRITIETGGKVEVLEPDDVKSIALQPIEITRAGTIRVFELASR